MGYEVPADKQSLDCFFTAFNIVLERGDYTQPNNNIPVPSIPPPDNQQPTFPGDPLTIDSLYYINRFLNGNNSISLEQRCYEEILKPHSLIRIKAPKLLVKLL